MTPESIIQAWFSPPLSQHWFNSTPDIDQHIREQFEAIWEQARDGQLDNWQESANGCLALCIILDQFPLNMFRGLEKSFITEQQAVMITKYAILRGFDQQLPDEQVGFLYMPLMHSEHLDDQALSVQVFEQRGLTNNLRFAQHHQAIVQDFGRFPHRNAILGRESTEAELAYLNSEHAFKG